jgi:hypothetical protein
LIEDPTFDPRLDNDRFALEEMVWAGNAQRPACDSRGKSFAQDLKLTAREIDLRQAGCIVSETLSNTFGAGSGSSPT